MIKSLILFIFLMVSCSKDEPTIKPDKEDDKKEDIDISLTKKNYLTEDEAVKINYDIFYKPINGVTGDPMPYYNSEDNTFYIYFLLGRFSGYPGGGIYLTKTKDFANFVPSKTPQAQILTGASGTYDENMGTGKLIKRNNNYHFFYTAFKQPVSVTKATFAGDLSNANWIKAPSLQLNAPSFFNKNEYRDPDVYWDNNLNKYVMIVGGIAVDGRASIIRFQSDDLTTWEEIPALFQAADSNNPQKYEFPTDSDIPECPEIFEMGGKWYLVFSRINRDNHRKTFYRIADSPEGPWKVCRDENGHHETFDGLWLYAAKTVSDGKNRYVTGWASLGQDKQPMYNELTWGGNLITHKLVQQSSGKLYPTIPDALDSKFTKIQDYKDIKREGNVSETAKTYTLSNNASVVFNRNISNLKIEMKIDASQSNKGFGIAFGAYENQADAYKLKFDLTKQNEYALPALFMTHKNKELNFTPLIVPNNKIFNVKIIIEKQVCVMYVNGNVAFTNHISNMEENPWMIFSEEGSVKFSDIKIYN